MEILCIPVSSDIHKLAGLCIPYTLKNKCGVFFMDKINEREIVTMDGNQAAAHVSYAYSQVAAIFPITPSSPMAEAVDEWAAAGKTNIYGEVMQISEMQSEAGAAAAVHGALTAGALATTYTASQGLLLMIPNIYKIAGEQLPGVINVAARTVASHALSIFGDHSDIYACRQTGAAIIMSSSVQQVMDISPVSYMASISGKLPFLNCFDGFRTSHEIQKIRMWSYKQLEELMDKEAVTEFRKNALNPEEGAMMGSAQNPDVFFQAREAVNQVYEKMIGTVEQCFDKINRKIGSDYGLFNYYGHSEATDVIVAMGSVCQTIEETIDILADKGEKNGLVEVHLYRPFSVSHFLKCIPKSVKRIHVLDRTKEPGAVGEPLYLDVASVINKSEINGVNIYHGRYGLSSKNTTPSQIAAVFHNRDKEEFTIGIHDDVTGLSLEEEKEVVYRDDKGIFQCKFWGLGGDGTVSGNKNSIKIIGNHTDMYVQAYFDYDSKKSRGLTISNLRFGNKPIKSTYYVEQADFVACHNETYLWKYDMVNEVKPGGAFLINCSFSENELEDKLPAGAKRYIAENNIRVYLIDGLKIGREIGLNSKISTILQAAFFAITEIIPIEEAIKYMKQAAEISYGAQGDNIVRMNYRAIEEGTKHIRQVKINDDWRFLEENKVQEDDNYRDDRLADFIINIQRPVAGMKGDDIPVSAFLPYNNGCFPSGGAAYERRNTAVDIPIWIPENCIQCNRCSYVCPHSVIRPAVMDNEEAEKAPSGMKHIPMNGFENYRFSVVISYVDCTGCGSCAGVCPGMKDKKALKMIPAEKKVEMQAYFDYAKDVQSKEDVFQKFKVNTVKGSQFKKPLMEFCGACAGCGESPYAKLLTQLYGERMYIANATGCTSIWGNSMPSTVYTVNKEGKGPAWSNSLFEDAAEFGYGMLLAADTIRDNLRNIVLRLVECKDSEIEGACRKWLDNYENSSVNAEATKEMTDVLENSIKRERNGLKLNEYEIAYCNEIISHKNYLAKKSCWVFGGDGWAYDIGFGGLDHVLASGRNINMFVFDTEVYSNTGGQASKATPYGASAKFCPKGKLTPKKRLAQMIMTYENVYVAQIAMGADYNQTVKAITEAEEYEGPSLIIAYSPCVCHGIRAGMGSSMHEQSKAVRSGYFELFRYDPRLINMGKEPLITDSRKNDLEIEEFYSGEIRFSNM